MAITLYSPGTEYTANAITMKRGSAADITWVGVYHGVDPNHTPTLADFQQSTLVVPPNPMADGSNIDILTLVGPGGDIQLVAGVYQRWALVKTATENIVRKLDTVTVL
jgi:hypothetical protein